MQTTNMQSSGTLSGVQWFAAPHCSWNGRMVFDGAVVYLEGDIAFDAAMRTALDQNWRIAGNSQTMEIHLLEPIDFNSETTQQTDLQRVVLGESPPLRR